VKAMKLPPFFLSYLPLLSSSPSICFLPRPAEMPGKLFVNLNSKRKGRPYAALIGSEFKTVPQIPIILRITPLLPSSPS
jgi:hypothetical protein